VLSAVSSEINCVFLHLENPRLCDRNAVEIVAAIETTVAGRRVRLPVVLEESRSKPVYRKAGNVPVRCNGFAIVISNNHVV
jgi:hypothetical protein